MKNGGMSWFSRKKSLSKEKGPLILIFHKVVNDLNALFGVEKQLSVSVEDFKGCMKRLLEKYKPLKLSDYVLNFEKDKDYSRYFIVTFDDGYEDNLSRAYPILEKMGIPMTIFVSTNLINGISVPFEFVLSELILAKGVRFSASYTESQSSNEVYYNHIRKLQKEDASYFSKAFSSSDKALFDEMEKSLLERKMFLSWDQLGQMIQTNLVDIGGHGKDHLNLKSLEVTKSYSEMQECLDEIDGKLNVKTFLYSYPYGSFESNHSDFLKKGQRVKGAVATQNVKPKTMFNLKRKEWFELNFDEDGV